MNQMKGKLGVYHLMIVSKYFESIDDHINMELATPKAKGNMEKFHFNPIPLDKWSRTLFTSLETFHHYNENDEKFEEEEFFQRVYWTETKCDEKWLEQKKENETYKNLSMGLDALLRMRKIPDGVVKLVYSKGQTGEMNQPLEELVIPDSVTSIVNRLLSNECRKLTALTVPTHWEQVGNRIFNNKPFFCSFQIPESVKLINGKDIKEVEEFDIPTYVTKLDEECFFGCEFTKITIPTSIREIPLGCFCLCEQLKELTIPTTITKLGAECFGSCTSLESLIIPTSVVEIENLCFYRMESLKEIEVPTSVTEIGEYVFRGCGSLTSVTLHDNYKEVKDCDFWCCESLSSIELPSTVTRIGEEAFYCCGSLTSINLSNIKEFGESCFYGSEITKEDYPELPDHCWEQSWF